MLEHRIDVALVLDRRGLDDVSVLSPVDSGDYSISCDPGQWAAGFCGLWDGNATACGQFWYCALEAGGAAACGLNQTALAGRERAAQHFRQPRRPAREPDGEAEAETEEEFFAQELLKAGGEVLTKVDGY